MSGEHGPLDRARRREPAALIEGNHIALCHKHMLVKAGVTLLQHADQTPPGPDAMARTIDLHCTIT